MRALAYAKDLARRRASGDDFWLAVVALGWLRDARPFAGDSGVARLGCAADTDPAAADWRALMGLDVLVSRYEVASERFVTAALEAMWRARCATLWTFDGPAHVSRLERIALGRRADYVTWNPRKVPLDRFRAVLAEVRQLAFLDGDEPLFSGVEFVPARLAFVSNAQAA